MLFADNLQFDSRPIHSDFEGVSHGYSFGVRGAPDYIHAASEMIVWHSARSLVQAFFILLCDRSIGQKVKDVYLEISLEIIFLGIYKIFL